MTLSKERVEFYAATEPPFGYTGGDIQAMARELLERRKRDKQEPFGFTDGERHGMCYEPRHADRLRDPLPLYRAAMHAATISNSADFAIDEAGQSFGNSEQLNSPAVPDGWVKCSERMPELDTRVLLYFANCSGHIEDGCIGDEGDGAYHYFFDGNSLSFEPTHWQPLPAAPKQESE